MSAYEGTGDDMSLKFLISFHQVAGEQDFRCSNCFDRNVSDKISFRGLLGFLVS